MYTWEGMVKPKLYLDTSVPSAYVDTRAPERQRLTQRFWDERLLAFEPVVSIVTVGEITDTPEREKRVQMLALVAAFDVLELDDEARALAREYVQRGVFAAKYVSDANHVAVAVVNDIRYLASWNFRHLVKVSTRQEVNLINAIEGYGAIEIAAPPEW